jgi:hypothetical protein
MRWLKRKLRNWLNNDGPDLLVREDYQSTSNRLDNDLHNHVKFSIYGAQGGKVVEVKTWDKKHDRWDASLHIINSDENFGDSLSKIIFTESLRRGL